MPPRRGSSTSAEMQLPPSTSREFRSKRPKPSSSWQTGALRIRSTPLPLRAPADMLEQDEQDQLTALRALTAKRSNPSIHIFAQAMQPENLQLLINAGVDRANIM
eukprot:764706-Hanusia_phi.AAC.3